MFKKWLETHEDASWYQLIKALKRVELIHLASQIELLLGKLLISNTEASYR